MPMTIIIGKEKSKKTLSIFRHLVYNDSHSKVFMSFRYTYQEIEPLNQRTNEINKKYFRSCIFVLYVYI